MHGTLPNLLILGFPKCGTHALLHNLGRHPDVHTHPEEVGFFGRERSLEEYMRLFRPDRRFNGEKSAIYVYRDEALREMRARVPDARLFVCLRHPVQWAHSFYNFRVWEFQSGFPPGFDPARYPFEKMVLDELDVSWFHIRRGCFVDYIRGHVLRHFGPESLEFVVQERMAADLAAGMNDVFACLGLAPCDSEWERTRRHHGDDLGYPTIRTGTQAYRKALRKLLALYEPAIDSLYELLGEEIPEWGPITAHYRARAR